MPAMLGSVEQEQGERSIFGSCGNCSDTTDNNSMPRVCVEEHEALSFERIQFD